MNMSTYLVSGAGNTFHICDLLLRKKSKLDLSVSQKKEISKNICLKQKADGFIFLKEINNGQSYAWDFYNNDGSDAEMCGNATRCVGYYVSEVLKNTNPKILLQTTAGLIEIEKKGDHLYKVKMTPPRILQSSLGFFCDTGVPHLVQEINHSQDYHDKKNEALLLRNHLEFKPNGTNVTYVQFLTDLNKLNAVSYERGVENFTKACGTGAMAAALYNLMKRGSSQTQVEMPGGTLMMDLTNLNEPLMEGPAVLLGKYNYDESIE